MAPGSDILNGNIITLAISAILYLLTLSNMTGIEAITTAVTVFTTTLQSLIQELSSSSPAIAQVEQYFSVITNLGNYPNNLLNS